MFEPSYRQALTHAWQLVWRHKILWVFGLISVLAGQFGLNNFVGQLAFFFQGGTIDLGFWSSLGYWFLDATSTTHGLVMFLWLSCIAVSLVALLAVAAVSAEGALIAVAAGWYRTRTVMSLSHAWHRGVKHFWRLLALTIFQKSILVTLVLWIVLFMNFYLAADGIGLLATALMIACVFFLALVVSSVGVYAAGYVVIDELSLYDSIASAWRLFRRHVLVSLELSCILVFLNIVVVLLLSLLSFAVLVPSFFLTIIGGLTGYTALISAAAILYLVLFVVFAATVGAAFNAYTTSAWMYLFLKMHHEGMYSRLVRGIKKLFRLV